MSDQWNPNPMGSGPGTPGGGPAAPMGELGGWQADRVEDSSGKSKKRKRKKDKDAAIAAMKITNSVAPRPGAHPPTRRCTCLPPRPPVLAARGGQGPARRPAPPIRCFDAAACAVSRQPPPRSERLLFVPCAQIHPPVGAYAVLLADVPAIKARPPPPSVPPPASTRSCPPTVWAVPCSPCP